MKAKITAALLTIFLSMSSWAQMVSQTTDSGIYSGGPGFGQTFTATATTQISKISVRLAEAYTGTLLIYNGANGSGTLWAEGTPAYTQAGVSLAASGIGGPLQDIVLTTPFPVTAGNTYTFVFQGDSYFYTTNTNPYAGGLMVAAYADVTFAKISDLAFQVWTVAAPPTSTPSIPTLSEWGVLALALLLGLFALAKGYGGKRWRQ